MRRGMAFSLLSLTWFLPGFYSQLLAGFLGDRIGVRRVFYITLAMDVLALLLFAIFVKETLKKRKPIKLKKIISGIRETLRPQRGLAFFYIVSILDRLAWALGGGIFVAIIYESFGFTLLQIGTLTTVTSITTTLCLIPAGRLVDRHGSRAIMLIAVTLAAAMFLGFMSTSSFPLFIVFQAFKGLSIALWDPAHNAYISNAVKESERGRLFGSLNGLKGILVFPAPLIGAYLYETYGYREIFMTSLVITLLTLILTFKIKEEKIKRESILHPSSAL